MFHFLTNPSPTDAVAFLSLLGLVIALAIGAVTSWRRSRELAKLEPPTPEEVEEIRSLRSVGSFHLHGRSSAMARHYEHSLPRFGDRIGGGRGCYEPPLVESWREHRTED